MQTDGAKDSTYEVNVVKSAVLYVVSTVVFGRIINLMKLYSGG